MERCFIISKGCKLYRDYMAYIENSKEHKKPVVAFYFDELFFRTYNKLFMFKNILYASVSCEQLNSNTPIPYGWNEITKSEFNKVIKNLRNGCDDSV